MGIFSKPKAPDPAQTANTQLGYNKDAAQSSININSINKSGPFGSSTFTKDASGNTTGIQTSLDPSLTGTAGNITGNLGAVTGSLPTAPFDSTGVKSTSDIAKMYYDKGAALLDPQFSQARNEQDINLTNRGLPIGSEARNTAEGNLARSQSVALSDLASQSNLAASSEQQRLIDNARKDYTQPYDIASGGLGLLTGLKGLTPEASQPSAAVGSPDYTSTVNNNYNAATQQYNNTMTGVGQLAGAGAGLMLGMPTGGYDFSKTLAGSLLKKAA